MFGNKKIRAVVAIMMSSSISTPPLPAEALPLTTAEHAEAIYRHLIEWHWTPRTGLFRSFPDSSDLKLSQQASTYEQAAMGLLAIRFGDVDRARQLLDFFKTAWTAGPEAFRSQPGARGLANFYNADFGSEGIAKTVNLGPNAGAGLLAANLANTAKDPQALQLAVDIESWIANVLPHSNGGAAMGLRDDPYGASWSQIYSTENNLSYYAFLTELLRSPVIEKAQRVAITQERDHVENWLVKVAFDPHRGLMHRGTNLEGKDATAALDTTTWLISAVGPQRLTARGIDPYLLMQTAEKTFEVTVAGHVCVDAADQQEATASTPSSRATRKRSTGRPTTSIASSGMKGWG